MVPDTSKSSKDDSDGKKLYQNPFMKQPGTSTELNGVGLPEGMTWVSPKGQPLHPPRPLPTCKEFSKRGMLLLTKDKVSEADGLRMYRERSRELWKTINPGCMPVFVATPISTTMEHFETDDVGAHPPAKRFFRQKNEFTEHTEQGASTMKILISNK